MSSIRLEFGDTLSVFCFRCKKFSANPLLQTHMSGIREYNVTFQSGQQANLENLKFHLA
jgi:hypothetical protein